MKGTQYDIKKIEFVNKTQQVNRIISLFKLINRNIP